MTASTTVLICLLSYLFLSFFFTYNYAADQIYYSNRPTSQMTKPFVYQLASGAPVALSIKYFDNTGDYDNVYHFIPDNPSAKSNFTMRFYVDGFSNIAWSALLTSLVSGWNSVSKCGVLVKSSLSSSRESTTSQNSTFFNTPLSISNSDKFNCVVSANFAKAGLFEVLVTPKSNYEEGVYLFEYTPVAGLTADQSLFQAELVVYSKTTFTKLVGNPVVDPNSLLEIQVAQPSIIDPTNPPNLDNETSTSYIPLRDNFGMNAIVSSAVSNKMNLIYTWQVMRVYKLNTAIIDVMPKTNYLGKSNTLQAMYQQNSLGYSSLVLSQDKILYADTAYKVVASVYSSSKTLIARKIKYLRTPLDFSPVLSTVGTVSPTIVNFTDPLTFKVTSNFKYSDNSDATNLQFAFGYLDTSLIKSSDVMSFSNLDNVPYSTIMQGFVRVTDYSTSKIISSYLPPSYALGENQKSWKTLLFVKDLSFGNVKTYALNGVIVKPVALEEIYRFVLPSAFMSVSIPQLKGVVGFTRKSYQSTANSTLIDLVQRRLFAVIQNKLATMTENDTDKLADLARILDIWAYNAKKTMANMVNTDGDAIFTLLYNFISMIKKDANQNKYTGDVTSKLPLGMKDGTVLDILTSLLSSWMKVSQFKSKTASLVKMLSTSIVDSISPSEERRYSTDSIVFSIRKDYASNFNGTTLTTDSSYHSVVMPTVSVFNSTKGLYGTEFVTYLENPNNSTSSSGGNITSDVISLRCINPSGDYFPLSELTDPIVLNFNLSIANISNPDLLVCKYWNETVSDWLSNGCTRTALLTYGDYYVVECSCDHTTQFATFVEFPTSTTNLTLAQKQAYYILWGFDIGIGVIFVIVSLIMLLLICIFRNSQPVKAKYIAPFVGMTSIFLESLLSYVVKSSLMIGFTATNSTNISFYLNTITYCSAVIISVAFAETGEDLASTDHFLKEFVRFSIGRIVQESLNSDTSKQIFTSSIYTIVTSSFMGAILLFSLVAVSLIFIVDLIYAFAVEYRKPYIDTSEISGTLVEMSESQSSSAFSTDSNSNSKKKFKDLESFKKAKDITMSSMYKFFVQDDPLFFRCESLLFIFCLGVLLISYVFGIVGLGFFTLTGKALSTSESAFETSLVMDIIRLVLSVVYFVLYILVFGDLSLLIYIFKYRKYRVSSTSGSTSFSSESRYDNELQEILNDGLAYSLFEKFTVKEFSKENLLCYNSLQELEDEKQFYQKDLENQVKMLEEIIEKYLTQTSSFEVNIPSNTRKNLINLIKSKEGLTKENVKKSLESLKSDILVNLTDTFSRFTTSQSYEFWTQIKEEKERLMARNKMV
ncbi:predicted protein [Naegleria gruberi]|uniref:Predicted protein n=1 Tax=Naegleria gruberi TaxID=5762 RepID=D2VWZ9_NAEGR|nr:uncharacterized protein NAEGRDRAFT_73564 [Naegleria gruberi]EFC38714.1 predicted protein [Naegleria gruberi]|eukprot:XP_002671458.1 predicted protein [Naegleria gruberi strain NEG-M]